MREWITEQRSLCDAATDRPWKSVGTYILAEREDSEDPSMIEEFDIAETEYPNDAAFIAAARTSLPKVLDVLKSVEEFTDLCRWNYDHQAGNPGWLHIAGALSDILATLDENE